MCATDLHAIDGLMEPAGLRPPVVLGHENAGWVHAVGDDVTAASVGDAVLVYPAYSCGLCVACRRGQDMLCERHQFTGLTRDGGFADFVLVDERSLVPLPPGVEPVDVAPHADAGITAYHAVKKLLPRLVPGTNSVVIGVGGVGHIALQLLRVLGGGAVIAVDTDERRRGLAKELGADEVLGAEGDVTAAVREATNGAGADVVLDFVATDATHAAGLEMLARRGLYSTVGYGGLLTRPLGRARRRRDGDHRQSRRQLDRPLGAAAAPRPRRRDAAHRDAPARRRERRARCAAGRRRHRPRGARSLVRDPVFTGTLQVAVVVPDLDGAMKIYVEDYGIGPWDIYEFHPGNVSGMHEGGSPVERSWRLAIAMVGDVQWELVEPQEDDSVYARFLAEHGPGVHHVGVAVSDFERTLAELGARGQEVLLGGTYNGVTFAYLSTDRDLGVVTEIFDRAPGRDQQPDATYPPDR